MSVYIPNEAEKEVLKAVLLQQAMVVGLYKNQVIPDGNTVFATLEEMPTGGGRGYAPFVLTNDVKEGAVAADMWAMVVNASGKAEAAYDNAVQEWTFLAPDVADGNTVYGVFGYTLVLPFDAGVKEIKVGDTIKGGTSGATGVVTGINITSGTWAAGTAAGNLYIKSQSGTFQNDENLIVLGEVGTLNATPAAGGTGYAVGDLVEITTGGVKAYAIVTTVNAGVVTGIHLATGGHGYTTGTGKVTAKITGAGNNDLTVNITALATAAYAVSNTGGTGNSHKKLLFVEALTTAIAVTTLGQKISYNPKLTMSTA